MTVTITPQAEVIAFAAADDTTMLLKGDGSLWGAGNNWFGLLGLRDVHARRFQAIVPSGVVDFSLSQANALFLKSDGSLWGMGDNTKGAIGPPEQYIREPHKMVESGVVGFEAGFQSSFYILADGSAWAMGSNDYVRLGLGNIDSTSSAQRIFDRGVKRISAHNYHTLFVMENGSLWATGEHWFGGLNRQVRTPEKVIDSKVVDAVAGRRFNLILM